MATVGNCNDPELRLLRYLYIGKEYPNYQPGYWFAHDYFIVRNVRSIEELAEEKEKELVPLELITKAFEGKLITHPEALVFALAVCCRQNKSEVLRQAAYKSVKTICASTPNFILFVKFASKLCRENELNFVTQGWGQGLRKAINNWYLSKEPLDFVKCVMRYRSRYGWKHKDILKLAHPLGNSPASKIILKYIIHGMEKTKAELEENHLTEDSDIKLILKYIENVESFKHCEDECQAASMLEMYELSLDHVPGHLLRSKEIWNSLISSMDVIMLLNNLQRIHNLGFLVSDEPAVEKVKDQLTNEENIVCSEVHPALVFITLKNYQCSGKSLTYEKRKVRELAKKTLPPPYKPNDKIIDALNTAFLLSFKNVQSTNLRYLVTISTHKNMEGRTWQNGNMTGIETASLIIMLLLRSEENVDVVTFENNEITKLEVNKTNSFEDILKVLKAIPLERTINMNKPILWAKKQSEKYDVLINVIDQIYPKYIECQENLISYKTELKIPHARLITCALCCSSPYRKFYDRYFLTINGFDATVPKVIQAFVQGLF
ncbi:hypothetical protein P5V15_005015 [Pogonomyrmex californicus]